MHLKRRRIRIHRRLSKLCKLRPVEVESRLVCSVSITVLISHVHCFDFNWFARDVDGGARKPTPETHPRQTPTTSSPRLDLYRNNLISAAILNSRPFLALCRFNPPTALHGDSFYRSNTTRH